MLVAKAEWKRQHGRPGRRWEDNIGMDLRERGRVGRCGVESSGSGY